MFVMDNPTTNITRRVVQTLWGCPNRFWGNIRVPDGKAETLVSAIKKELLNSGIELQVLMIN